MSKSFNFSEYNHFMSSVKDMSRDKAERILYEDFLTNESFAGALFNPSDSENITEFVAAMYKTTAKAKATKLLITTVLDYGYDKFDRWVGTYLYSTASFNLDVANEMLNEIDEEYEKGKISKSQANSERDDVDHFMDLTSKLNKVAGKIVKSEAKRIASESGLDKEFVKYALKTNPNPKFISNNKIGYFLNQLLNELYSELDVDECSEDIEDINWRYFFKSVYGKDNLLDVATFILLEGAHRTKDFKTNTVRKIWDSLTAFALDTLEDADFPSRNQMLELYLKRIEKMFANGSFDLRVDLRKLPENKYPKLTEAVGKFAERISKAFGTKTTKHA